MKRILLSTAIAAITISATSLVVSVNANAADVGVSVSIGQPGFYGQIDIGNFPRPQLVYPQPVLIQPVPVGIRPQPIYLRVPPGHAKNWAKHCGHYDACGRPVYFVQDNWYNKVYVPGYRERQGGRYEEQNDQGDQGRGRGHGKDKDKHGRGHGHDD